MRDTPARIALLTDFGDQDTYVGVMKGVISGIAPLAETVDITHQVSPGDIRRAAFQLWQSVPFFPPGTIFLVVVDPGVGTGRKPVAARWQDQTVVAPDNGLLTYLLASDAPEQAVYLDNSEFHLESVSATFHGRDVFAPAAAHLARGIEPDQLGSPAGALVRFDLPALEWAGDGILSGEILHLDRFGNAITTIGRLRRRGDVTAFQPWLPTAESGELGSELVLTLESGLSLPLRVTFAAGGVGQPLAYLGSESLVEIAVNRGHAGDSLNLSSGQRVKLSSKD